MDKETRNYLTGVIFKIDFADPIKLLPDNIEKVQTKIKDRLSELDKGKLEMIEVVMGAEEQRTIRKKSDVFKFINKGKSERVQIEQNAISFEVKNYKDFEYFRTLISDVLTEFNLKGNSGRLGLRYINQITIGEGNPFDWKGWVNANLITGLEFVDKKELLARSMGIITYIFDDFNIKFQYGMYNSEFPNPISKREFVLDYDCTTKEPRDLGESIDLLDRMHDLIKEKFEGSIDIEFRKQIGEAPV